MNVANVISLEKVAGALLAVKAAAGQKSFGGGAAPSTFSHKTSQYKHCCASA